MVEPEQVQQPVGSEQLELVEHRVSGRLRLHLRDLRAEHDVAQESRGGLLVLSAGAQLVHREAQHVGRTRLIHPLHMQLLHCALVHQHDREFGVGVHMEGVERIAGEAQQRGIVDGDARFIVDLDAHGEESSFGSKGGWAQPRGGWRSPGGRAA